MDLAWGKDRPARPVEMVKVHPIKFAGKSSEEKISELRKELEKKKRSGFIICRHHYPQQDLMAQSTDANG